MDQKKKEMWTWAWIGLCVVLLVSRGYTGGGLLTPTKVDQVTYFFEKDDGEVPSAVRMGLDQLNAMDIVATEFDVDTKNGKQQVPKMYELGLAAAKAAGVPALVSEGAGRVIKVVKAPTTTEQTVEIVK